MAVKMELVEKVLATIRANQDRWDQQDWTKFKSSDSDIQDECNTQLCFGGWAIVLSGTVRWNSGDSVDGGFWENPRDPGRNCYLGPDIAQEVLGFNAEMANAIFYGQSYGRDIDDFEQFVRNTIRQYDNASYSD